MADGSITIDVRLKSQKAIANLAELNAKIVAQKQKVQELEKEYQKWQTIAERQKQYSGSVSPQVQNSLELAGANLEAARAKLTEMETEAERAGTQIRNMDKNTKSLPANIKKATSAMAKFAKRLKSAVASALIFSTIYKALSAIREYYGNALESNNEFMAAVSKLKGAFLTVFQPLWNIAVPALTALVTLLARGVTAIGNFLSKFFGQDYAAQAKALYDEANAIDAVGSSSKKASKSLAGFDQINTIGSDSSSSSSSATPDFSMNIGSKISGIETIVSGALLALGAILTFSGANIPLGIALMAAGAVGLVSGVTENWETISTLLQGSLGGVTALVSGALLAIGAVLTFSGVKIPLGIAMMAIGAAGLVASVTANWDTIKNTLSGVVGDIVGVLSGALLATGAVLAFSGANIPLGIAMMVVGAAGLAAVVALNWDEIKNHIGDIINEIVTVTSVLLLALGLVLTMSGANLPLGIGLIVAGAAGLAAEAALNWDKIKNDIQGEMGGIAALTSAGLLAVGLILTLTGVALPLGIALMAAGAASLATVAVLNWDKIKTSLQGSVGGIVAIASGALLVLGIILVCTGVGIPLGIALIAAGAAGLVTVTAVNWNAITEKIKGVWESIKQWWNTSVKKYFTIAFWKEKFSSIAEGLKAKIKDGINAAITLFNRFIDWVNEKLNISWKGITIGGKEIIKSGSFQLLTIPKIPALANGAVIPPNHAFTAVLGDQKSGTNIETPLATMIEAFKAALNDGGYGDAVVQLYLDGEKVAENTIKRINNRARASGRLNLV